MVDKAPEAPLKISPKCMAHITQIKGLLNAYLQGVLDTMGIEGDVQLNDVTGEIILPSKNKNQ